MKSKIIRQPRVFGAQNNFCGGFLGPACLRDESKMRGAMFCEMGRG